MYIAQYMNWYAQEIPKIFNELKTSNRGLAKKDAMGRRAKYGSNKLPEAKANSLLIIFIQQFQSPLIYVLFLASAIVFMMGETVDGLIIVAVLLFNAIVGTVQEGRAQNTLVALKKFVETEATVLREGEELIISDADVVVGDIIVLQEGERVPADARVISSNKLKVDEAALTGESAPVYKESETIRKSNVPTAGQKNMVFKGTYVVAGNGIAVITATGLETVIGKISKEISSINTEIPLKKNIRQLSRFIIVAAVSISAVLFIVGVMSGSSVREMFATVVSLSVSIIPEGLPIVMTIILAAGVWRMSKHNALVKNLQAIEALGQANVIAVDKTGTITKNELMVQNVYTDGKLFTVSGTGYSPKGEIVLHGTIVNPLNHPELLLSGKIAALCSNARAMFLEDQQQWRVAGDPTEAALSVFGEKIGFRKEDLERESEKIAETPFDYELKYHATAHRFKAENKELFSVVGAPESVLSLCTKIWRNGRIVHLSEKEKKELMTVFANMSRRGMRVVAFAANCTIPKSFEPKSIHELAFAGFFGMMDTLRSEVIKSVQNANAAGIKIVMITGDHVITAKAIAQEAGIYHEGDGILTGPEIDGLSEEELAQKIKNVSVFARVTPEHKLHIIRAYRRNGDIVAMTGDGVNDAPSLVAADLGVAMGNIGTEVAKEASDIVLLDDNFGNILLAVEEGRNIYRTIKNVVLYLFSTSLGEVLTIAGALFLGYPIPILPAQIIWLNFVTDGFLTIGLAMEPKETNLIKKKFTRPRKYLIDYAMMRRMLVMATSMMIGTLFLFREYINGDLAKAWTIALTTLAVFQWFNAWNCRSEEKSVFRINPFSNMYLVVTTLIVIGLQLFAVYSPIAHQLLRTAPLTISEWVVIVVIAASIILIEEIRKFFHRKTSS